MVSSVGMVGGMYFPRTWVGGGLEPPITSVQLACHLAVTSSRAQPSTVPQETKSQEGIMSEANFFFFLNKLLFMYVFVFGCRRIKDHDQKL